MPFPLPSFIQFYPTLRCNQRCSFCFNRGMTDRPDMRFEDSLGMLDRLAGAGVGVIDIMGGEPLLLDWMPEFVSKATASGMSVNLSTNGSMPDRIAGFRSVPPGKLRIGVSIEGSDGRGHETLTGTPHFHRALATVAAIREIGLEPLVKTVVTKETIPAIPLVADLLEQNNVADYVLIHMDALSASPDILASSLGFTDFLRFFEHVRASHPSLRIGKVHASCFARQSIPPGVRCAGGVRKLAVMPDGSVFPCNLLAHWEEFLMGNIRSQEVAEIWASSAAGPLRTCSGNTCSDASCSNHRDCTGGCPAHNVMHSRGIAGRDIRCSAAGQLRTA